MISMVIYVTGVIVSFRDKSVLRQEDWHAILKVC